MSEHYEAIWQSYAYATSEPECRTRVEPDSGQARCRGQVQNLVGNLGRSPPRELSKQDGSSKHQYVLILGEANNHPYLNRRESKASQGGPRRERLVPEA